MARATSLRVPSAVRARTARPSTYTCTRIGDVGTSGSTAHPEAVRVLDVAAALTAPNGLAAAADRVRERHPSPRLEPAATLIAWAHTWLLPGRSVKTPSK